MFENKTLHDLVGSFHVTGLNKDDWQHDKDKVSFRFGIYTERTRVDWILIDVFRDANGKASFNCSDGHSPVKKMNNIEEDNRINCFINETRSKVTEKDGKLYVQAHFIRPFKTDDV